MHWSKRSLTDTNKTLWGNFLIQYKNKKILFACDTGYGNIYKEIGEKYGPIDITMINIGAYDFRPMFDKSIYHTTPEEALNVAQDLKSKKVLGMHWGTFVLSLEPIMEPPIRFKENAEKFGFKKEDAITFKIGEINYIFCSDNYILKINKDYLNHNYFTDIITFNYNEGKKVNADIFISIDTVKSNANSRKIDFYNELHRVMVHGILHLVGYNDKTPTQQIEMTSKEDYYLNLRA